jgi:hypothetical protein
MKTILLVLTLTLAACGGGGGGDVKARSFEVIGKKMCNGVPCVQVKGVMRADAKATADQAKTVVRLGVEWLEE